MERFNLYYVVNEVTGKERLVGKNLTADELEGLVTELEELGETDVRSELIKDEGEN